MAQTRRALAETFLPTTFEPEVHPQDAVVEKVAVVIPLGHRDPHERNRVGGGFVRRSLFVPRIRSTTLPEKFGILRFFVVIGKGLKWDVPLIVSHSHDVC